MVAPLSLACTNTDGIASLLSCGVRVVRWEQIEHLLRGSLIIRPNIIALSSLFCFSLLTK